MLANQGRLVGKAAVSQGKGGARKELESVTQLEDWRKKHRVTSPLLSSPLLFVPLPPPQGDVEKGKAKRVWKEMRNQNGEAKKEERKEGRGNNETVRGSRRQHTRHGEVAKGNLLLSESGKKKKAEVEVGRQRP